MLCISHLKFGEIQIPTDYIWIIYRALCTKSYSSNISNDVKDGFKFF